MTSNQARIAAMAEGGWDIGRVYTTQINAADREDVLPDMDQFNAARLATEGRFYDFLREFALEGRFVYRDQLRSNLIAKKEYLEVQLDHVQRYSEPLANILREHPNESVPLFERAAKRLAQQNIGDNIDRDVQILLLGSFATTSIRDLNADMFGKLIRVPGIVINASMLTAKATHLHVTCKSCRHNKIIPVGRGIGGVQLPRNCDAEPGAEQQKTCPQDPFVIVHDRCRFMDQQTLKLQETPDMIPVGELPRPILLTCDRNLTNKVMPGSRITVTGIYSTFTAGRGKSTGTVGVQNAYIRVIGIQVDRDRSGRVGTRAFTPAQEEQYLAMSRRPDLYDLFAKSIAPSIFGALDIKKAITTLLFGGSRKVLPDGVRLRGDINVLMLGDPGTAKSQLLKFVEKVAPIAIYTSGKGSSAAGLTASVIRDPASREFYLEGGAMVLADGGVVCIDEFDKMREEDRVAIHEAMEQQTISIAKAGITTILNSRTSVLAAANPVFGRYDEMKTPGENIDFQSTILSRFDLIFIVRDDHNQTRDVAIAKHVLHVHQNRAQDEPDAVGDIDVETMRGYIAYCRSKCAPRLSEEAATKLSDHYVTIRREVKELERDSKKKSTIPITVRQLEAIIRVSEALAKMRLSPVATEQDVDEALRLFKYSTIDAIRAGQLEGVSHAELVTKVQQAEEQIKKRVPIGTRTSERILKDYLLSTGYTDSTIQRALNVLIQRGVMQYERRQQVLTRVSY